MTLIISTFIKEKFVANRQGEHFLIEEILLMYIITI
jgi:hypothetical protein